ncbi:Putative Acyl-CoA dehydrogenases [Aspergillus calidoustus]|uniref:Putative Acyl-CoA dehydrogenases n=1 Tax=Aspergillus calidoustus TaxID=454130 RepID=A0A0U5HI27_ASPCI|nr:Putative Acyl-CoA dehydrogenases [Aspergillus calidoustus]
MPSMAGRFKHWSSPSSTPAWTIHRVKLVNMFRISRLSHTGRRLFSTSARRPLMDLTGFTENQLTVRDAISTICANFPNTYWQECDQQERDPKEFHAALAKDGWLGIALPEEHGGAGLGMSPPTSLSTIFRSSQSMYDQS